VKVTSTTRESNARACNLEMAGSKGFVDKYVSFLSGSFCNMRRQAAALPFISAIRAMVSCRVVGVGVSSALQCDGVGLNSVLVLLVEEHGRKSRSRGPTEQTGEDNLHPEHTPDINYYHIWTVFLK
jgi:hypothetical protein